MEKTFNIGNFVEFAGCAQCKEKKCLPGAEEDRKACPRYEHFKNVNITDKYVSFWGGVFSNFYPCKIHFGGSEKFHLTECDFKSSEQYFMWLKATFFDDSITAREILNAKTPKEAKRLGRQVIGFDEKEWEEVREDMMYTAVYQKFKQNPELCRYLINPVTETRHFVEASKFDRIWGIGLGFGEDDDLICDEKNWLGQNLLGKVLDKVRLTLITEKMVK